MTVGPPLPPRTGAALDPDPIPDEPPPAYEPVPSIASNELTLEYGPSRPFVSAPAPAPPRVERPPQRTPSTRSHRYQPPNSRPVEDQPYRPRAEPLPPPTFPFWNGSNLTPAQTGFLQHGPSTVPSQDSTHVPVISYAPSTTPTPGQPLLYHGQLLVYPLRRDPCPKCSNTGYKPFVSYSAAGYTGDDPNHPCRKCWANFGQPYSQALKHSHNPIAPENYQRPLRLWSTPSGGTFHAPQVVPAPSRLFNASQPPLVVRPGDPRIGGMLCRTCGGDGLVMGPFIFDEVTCSTCRGTGRVF
ncbi:Hua1p [Sporobolomyces koalae]|uniref:Hua1p n=1 Tax=Sporobolomyces koalae TaxID=500713 RepID=UPI00316B7FB5